MWCRPCRLRSLLLVWQVNGNRVELGEVDAALGASPLVRAAASRLLAGRLVAYCVLCPEVTAELDLFTTQEEVSTGVLHEDDSVGHEPVCTHSSASAAISMVRFMSHPSAWYCLLPY